MVQLPADQFLVQAGTHPVLDVRSPSEYAHAHIPGAVNLPLLSDEERKIIGTIYFQEGREVAIRRGLDFFGVKMGAMAEIVRATVKSDTLLIHCWRGGMRSSTVAWLMETSGYRVFTLRGGYKAYRNLVLQAFTQPYQLLILGGFTGSGKTDLLRDWENAGGTMIDLENIACHRGSAFGAGPGMVQPGQEMFENLLAEALWKASGTAPIWLEDESQSIGKMILPPAFWQQMRNAPVLFLDIPFEERLDYLERTYGSLGREWISVGMDRVRKRLGGTQTKQALDFLATGNLRECFRILLRYYDGYYGKSIQARKRAGILINTCCCGHSDTVRILRMMAEAPTIPQTS
ncbi:MAG TPA: tRNA 2-selenouridine(34) synthase MnmH [Chitinophagaceae bacterium]|nr:tRNA 2-selenouridine(34) synthase MnmH [Chitinophagaceae bacterium]